VSVVERSMVFPLGSRVRVRSTLADCPNDQFLIGHQPQHIGLVGRIQKWHEDIDHSYQVQFELARESCLMGSCYAPHELERLS
jgi:hypothetical protein